MRYRIFIFLLLISAPSIAQQTEYVDFENAKVNLFIDAKNKYVSGKVVYIFRVMKPTDSIFLDSKKLSYKSIYLNNNELEYYTEGDKLWLKNDFKPSENNVLRIEYESFPKKAMYFVGWNNDAPNQVWTQGQGKYTSNWLPSFDDVNEKVNFDLSITFDQEYQVIANGKLINKEFGDGVTHWYYSMKKPMSSYLLAIAIGKYKKSIAYAESGIPIEMYYYPNDTSKVEPTYRYTKQLFDFLENEIGIPYPWQNYKQVPVHDFLYAGMENTSATIFSDAFVVDETAFEDKNYVNVNAHELAHQWFGDLVTAKSGEHHWLQEGFATYYALLAERKVFGDDYFFWTLYDYAQELLEQDKAGKSTSLLNPKSSSTTFYKKGAWVLYMLREKVGDDLFKKAIKKYLETYQFKNVETKDFFAEVEKLTDLDLKEFKEKWMVSKKLNHSEMIKNLYNRSQSIKSFLQMDCENAPEVCESLFLTTNDDILKQKLIQKLQNNLSKSVFNQTGIKPRQAIAQLLTKIPLELKKDYEGLLYDKSYLTIESALYNLWHNFPDDSEQYLNRTESIVGFKNKNVRLLWLVLALSTPEYQPERSQEFYNELVNYTESKYNFELRQNAFQYLLMLNSCNTACRINLVEATKHHNWRLSKFAKEQLKLINVKY